VNNQLQQKCSIVLGGKARRKLAKARAKFSAVCDCIRGKCKTAGLEAPHADPGNTSFLSSSHITPDGQSGLQVYHTYG